MTNAELKNRLEKKIERINLHIKEARREGESEEFIARLCGERTGYQEILEML